MKEDKRGISLIVLVITIVVIIIIATVVILTLNENSPVGRAREATFKSDMKTIEEEFAMYVSNKSVESKGKFELETLNAGEDNIIYNTKEGEGGNIYEVIPSAKKKYEGEFEIIKGELYYKGSSEGKLIWAKEIGIKINPYVIIDGELMSANSNLLLLDSNGKVTIPVTVTKISTGVFNNLEGLKEVYIPGNVKEIGQNAFSNNKTLEKVVIEDGVEIIGSYAFINCPSLKDVQMTDSVINIGVSAFNSCNNLEKITLSNSIKNIGAQVFSACSSLKIINLPESLTALSHEMFLGCRNLETLKFPKNLTNVAEGALGGCIKLNNIDVSENNNFIFEDNMLYSSDYKTLYAVAGTPSSIKINNLTEKILSKALDGITTIKEVYISEKVKEIGEEIPLGGYKLEKLEVSENNEYFVSEDNDLYSKNYEILYKCNKVGDVKVREGVKQIIRGVFLSDITSLELPNSLESIKGWDTIPTKVKKLYIPSNVKEIEIPALGTDLTEIEVALDNKYYKSVNNKYILSKDGEKLCFVTKEVKNIDDLPETVKIIGNYALWGCKNLENIVLKSGIEEIGYGAFYYMPKLTSIEIPSSIKSISSGAFVNVQNLTNIIIHKKKGEILGAPWGAVYGERVITYDK